MVASVAMDGVKSERGGERDKGIITRVITIIHAG